MMHPIFLTDSYKVSHYRQYPPDTEQVYSYFESRGGRFSEVVFFGLQYLLLKYLAHPLTRDDIDQAETMFRRHFGNELFHRRGWETILDRHQGRLPLSIRAVPEGTPVPPSNVLMTVENLDPDAFWLTNYVESLLVQVWYGCTVASLSREMKRIILNNLHETGTPRDITLKLHDFGFRGSTSVESAQIGGAAHLLNFDGTDNLPAIRFIHDYYHDEVGLSIPAAEHSTITSWGRDGEEAAYRNMLRAYPTGGVSVVSDSYDVFAACERLWGGSLKAEVLARNGLLVIRPDSGDPHDTLPRILEILGQQFGCETNPKGYKVLPPKVRLIQGDGVDLDTLPGLLATIQRAGWSGDNLAFGSGGGLLQKVNRDTCKFAFKCSSIRRSGRDHDVFKDPITDTGKRSKRGRLKLLCENGQFRTARQDESGTDVLQEVFRFEPLQRQAFSAMRQRCQIAAPAD